MFHFNPPENVNMFSDPDFFKGYKNKILGTRVNGASTLCVMEAQCFIFQCNILFFNTKKKEKKKNVQHFIENKNHSTFNLINLIQ